MVFTKLSTQDKDAFFGLLDEYFQSRPELFGQGGQGSGGIAGTGVSTAAAASVVQRALAANTGAGGGASGTKSNNPYAASMPTNSDIAHAVTVGRVAAASLAFTGGGSQSQSASQAGPPSLPRRVTSHVPVSTSLLDRVGPPGAEVDKLVTKKARIVSLSFRYPALPHAVPLRVRPTPTPSSFPLISPLPIWPTSVFSSFKKPENTGVAPAIPPAFASPKNAFGPPPVRRATSDTNSAGGGNGGAGIGGAATRGPALRQTAFEPEPEPETEAQGEWADVLYDYTSEDPGDLEIAAGTRVFVTDKSSDDWWTGQIEGQGREGLFPASYVKLL